MNQKQNTRSEVVLLAAGGTGGHLFPASALARRMKEKGHEVHLATDARGLAYLPQLEEMPVHKLAAATIFGGKIWLLPWNLLKIIFAFVQAVHLVLKLKPSIVVGFGGYPSFAPALAAQVLGRQVLIHEQNAVLGRANRVLCGLGAHLATSFGGTRGISKSTKTRTRKVGNPVRNDVLTAARGGYRYLNASRPFELLVFGGSQGASVFADTVPAAISELPADLKARLRVVHQVRRADMAQTLAAYGEISVYAEIRDFFDDLPARMRRAHLVICRGGASTLCELSLLGAPAIIVPLPGSLDQDQAHNVRELNEKGGAWMVSQTEFTTEWLSGKLNELMLNIELLNAASARSLSLARPDADLRLCRYALSLIKSDSSAGKEKKQ